MDFPGLGPANLLQNCSESQAEGSRLERLAAKADSAAGDRRALEEAAREFEAVFLNELLKAMRNTVPDNELFNSKGPTKFYQQMHDAEMARTLATGPARMGIADLIVEQLTRSAASAATDAAANNPAGSTGAVDLDQRGRRGKGQDEGEATESAASGPVPLEAACGPETGVVGLDAVPAAPAEPGAAAAALCAPDLAAAARRYRSLDVPARRLPQLERLRLRAEGQGSAVADTLRRYEDEIAVAARDSGLDPALVLAVVMEESGGDAQARSAKGALGLMQLMPDTAGELGVKDPTDPGANLAGGAQYLARMLERYEGNLDLALAAYNAGPGNVDKAGGRVPPFRETRNYVSRVVHRFQGLGGGTKLATGGR